MILKNGVRALVKLEKERMMILKVAQTHLSLLINDTRQETIKANRKRLIVMRRNKIKLSKPSKRVLGKLKSFRLKKC